jgi:hypothetical protein
MYLLAVSEVLCGRVVSYVVVERGCEFNPRHRLDEALEQKE